MWNDYLASIGENPESAALCYRAWHFCDNPRDADELARLVQSGVKRSTASLQLEYGEEPLPQENDLEIVTDWRGRACCVIRTTRVTIRPFQEVPPEFAAREGEGDGSLEYWRRVHWECFERYLSPLGRSPSEDMAVVCQEFEVVFPPKRVQAVAFADSP
jgi:uncharacterized protein YhfF